jgi:membrane protease YdiL (CAAX protease family)
LLQEVEPRAPALAPRWHTALLVALMLAVAVTGTLLQRSGAPIPAAHPAPAAHPGSRIVFQYLPILCVNWGLLLYVARLFRRHNALPELLGRRWSGGARAAVDLVLAASACVLIQLLQVTFTQHPEVGRNAAISALLPSAEAERLVWVLVAFSVGFCEEVVFRGYLQTQLAAFTGSTALGIVLQAALFGIAHAEQGGAAALRIACYGLILGGLAQLRRSLLPGIASHVAIDLVTGYWR